MNIDLSLRGGGFDSFSTQYMDNKIYDLVKVRKMVIFTNSSDCPESQQLINLLESNKVEYKNWQIDKMLDSSNLKKALARYSSFDKIPNVFIGGAHIGGNQDV